MYSKDSSTLYQKNSYIKYSENNINIPKIENKNKLVNSKLRTKSCDVKRRLVSKINIEKNRLALLDAMNINKEVIKLILLFNFIQLRDKLKKLTDTKNELIKNIHEKDDAILELSKFYEVSIILI